MNPPPSADLAMSGTRLALALTGGERREEAEPHERRKNEGTRTSHVRNRLLHEDAPEAKND